MNGSGQMWDKMAIQVCEMGANIFYSKNITRIEKDLDARYMLEINNECMEKADIVISSMPLGDLGRKILEIPKEVQKVTDNLQYRDMIIVAIEFDEKYVGKRWDELRNDTWLYVQQNDIQFGRIQFLNNWSPYASGDKKTILLETEIYCYKNEKLWYSTNELLINNVVDNLQKMQIIIKNIVIKNSKIERVEKAYPIYTGSYNQIKVVQDWINQQDNFYCIGRNGQHHYNNMDHSMLTAIEAAKHILNKTQNKKAIWEINSENVYHEEREDNQNS